MSNAATAQSTDKTPVIVAAAVAEAARLCDRSFEVIARLSATPTQRERARRTQMDQFRECGRISKRTERIVYELFDRDALASREELLAAIEVYANAGIAEVERRFLDAKLTMLLACDMHPTQVAYVAAKVAYVAADKALDAAALAAGIDFADDMDKATEADMMIRYDALAASFEISALVATLRAAEEALMDHGIDAAKRFAPRQAADLAEARKIAGWHASHRAKVIEFSLLPTP